MIATTLRCDRNSQCADRRPWISDGAPKLVRWGRTLYRTGVILAVLILGSAIFLASLDREPVFQRVASVVVLGAIPAIMFWGSGFIIFIVLKAVSSVYERTTARFRVMEAKVQGL
jgi:hypothetical protein